jgi:carbamoyltransferase
MGHWGAWRRNRVRIIERIGLSPAAFFSYLTCLCGFPLFDEGKVMGLAAYGQIDVPLLAWFRDHFRIDASTASLRTALQMRWTPALDLTRVDLDAFARHKYARWRLDFVGHDDSRWIDEIPPVDIASTGQHFFQQLLTEVVDIVVARTGLKSIACSGGAFSNVAMIGDLIRQRADVAVHVPLAPHDAGLALGAALWVRHTLGQARLTAPVSPYTGPSFSSEEVRRAIGDYGLSYAEPLDLCRTVASAIAAGKVVGWFNGRAEYGARALGARSVLADPRDRTARARLNQLLKRRDWFMPFAPSILEEYGEEYFEDFRPSPYMNVAFRVRKDKIADIPSAVHADGTCRAHSVSRAMHPEYHALITAFHGMTGIPMVLNSSFNRHGLPMVSTPRQALEHVLQGCVDVLAIGGFVVEPRRSLDVTRLSDDNGCLALMMLRHAASMAQSGRFTAADRALSRVETGMRACPDGLAYEGRTIWQYGSSLDELNRWWQAHHGAPPG